MTADSDLVSSLQSHIKWAGANIYQEALKQLQHDVANAKARRKKKELGEVAPDMFVEVLRKWWNAPTSERESRCDTCYTTWLSMTENERAQAQMLCEKSNLYVPQDPIIERC